MQDYFFTFGCDTPNANRYVRITATSNSMARNIMFEQYGMKWAFCYDTDGFKGQPEKYDLTELEHIEQAQGDAA